MLILPSWSTPMIAGTGAGENRFAESSAAVDQVAGIDEIVALGAQVVRHAVEGFAKLPEIALGPMHRHLHMQVARCDHIRRSNQAADRRDQPVGEIQSDQHGGQHHDQRDNGVHQAESHGDAEAASPPSAHNR